MNAYFTNLSAYQFFQNIGINFEQIDPDINALKRELSSEAIKLNMPLESVFELNNMVDRYPHSNCKNQELYFGIFRDTLEGKLPFINI